MLMMLMKQKQKKYGILGFKIVRQRLKGYLKVIFWAQKLLKGQVGNRTYLLIGTPINAPEDFVERDIIVALLENMILRLQCFK